MTGPVACLGRRAWLPSGPDLVGALVLTDDADADEDEETEVASLPGVVARLPLPGRRVTDAEPAYRLASPVVLAVVTTLFRLRTSGTLPPSGAVLLAPNHISFLDPLVVAVAAWRQRRGLRFLVVRGALDHPVTGPVIRAARQIPVEPGGGHRALAAAEDALTQGDVVVVYPEGGVVESGDERRPRVGVARLARVTGTPVTPAAMAGCERVRPWWRALRRRRAGVVFGPPVAPGPDEDDHAFAARVVDEIQRLVPGASATARTP